jgi:hypothetical protein
MLANMCFVNTFCPVLSRVVLCSHVLCWCHSLPPPQERVAAAQREDQEGREAAQRSRATRFAAGRQRYFDTLAAAPAAADPYEGLRPGCISAELAEALGESAGDAGAVWLLLLLLRHKHHRLASQAYCTAYMPGARQLQ